MMAMFVDSHAHLDQAEFDADRDEVIARAISAGVGRIVSVGLDVKSSRRSIMLSEEHSAVYATVGLHPSNAAQFSEALLDEMRDLARHPKVVGVGETGLDFYRERASRDAQELAFRRQLDLAAELGLPVIVHDREAHDATLEILGSWTSDRTESLVNLGVMHCFSGDTAMAKRVVAMGFLVSIAGPVTFPNARNLAQVVESLPLSSLLVETDCPFLAPQSFRGKRNEPAYVRSVADRIAQIKSCSVEDVATITTENARRLFRLGIASSKTT